MRASFFLYLENWSFFDFSYSLNGMLTYTDTISAI